MPQSTTERSPSRSMAVFATAATPPDKVSYVTQTLVECDLTGCLLPSAQALGEPSWTHGTFMLAARGCPSTIRKSVSAADKRFTEITPRPRHNSSGCSRRAIGANQAVTPEDRYICFRHRWTKGVAIFKKYGLEVKGISNRRVADK